MGIQKRARLRQIGWEEMQNNKRWNAREDSDRADWIGQRRIMHEFPRTAMWPQIPDVKAFMARPAFFDPEAQMLNSVGHWPLYVSVGSRRGRSKQATQYRADRPEAKKRIQRWSDAGGWHGGQHAGVFGARALAESTLCGPRFSLATSSSSGTSGPQNLPARGGRGGGNSTIKNRKSNM